MEIEATCSAVYNPRALLLEHTWVGKLARKTPSNVVSISAAKVAYSGGGRHGNTIAVPIIIIKLDARRVNVTPKIALAA